VTLIQLNNSQLPPPNNKTTLPNPTAHTPRGRDSPSSSDNTMVSKILFWSGFGTRAQPPQPTSLSHTHTNTPSFAGVAVRLWQLGIEMRPFFYRQGLFAYPIYGLVGASFGYWLQGMEDNQMRYLGETRDRLIEKRRRRAEREGGFNNGSAQQKLGEGLFASPQKGDH
jgi:hypothetical protein